MTVGSDAVVDISHSTYGASLTRTDNEGPINAAITAALSYGKFVYIPPVLASSPWQISSSLTIPSASNGLTIIGGSRVGSTIEQQTDNTPIFDCPGRTYGVTFEGLNLQYANQQTTSDTDAIAIKLSFQSLVGQNNVKWAWNVRNCDFTRCYIGIGTDGLLQQPWGWSIENVWMHSIAEHGIYWYSPGSPNNTIVNLYVDASSGAAGAGYALYSNGAEWRILGLDIEQWNDAQLYFIGGREVSIHGWHNENNSVTTTATHLLETLNVGTVRVENLRLSNFTLNNSDTCDIFKLGSGNTLLCDDFSVGSLTITSGTLYFLDSASGTGAYVRGYRTDANITPFHNATTNVRQFEISGASFQTFTASDTSPSVLGFSRFKTNNSVDTTITTFDDGYAGQEILIVFTDAHTTIAETSNIKLSASFTSTADDTMRLVYDGTSWFELSRSVN